MVLIIHKTVLECKQLSRALEYFSIKYLTRELESSSNLLCVDLGLRYFVNIDYRLSDATMLGLYKRYLL